MMLVIPLIRVKLIFRNMFNLPTSVIMKVISSERRNWEIWGKVGRRKPREADADQWEGGVREGDWSRSGKNIIVGGFTKF